MYLFSLYKNRVYRIFNPNKQKQNLFVFTGDMGTNVLNRLFAEYNEDNYFIAVSSDNAHLKENVKIDEQNKIFIGDKSEHSCGKRDFESGLDYVKSNRKRIKSILKKHPSKHIVLVAGLRYSSASGIIAGVSMITKTFKLPVTAIVSTPFATEGQNAFTNSYKAIIALNQNVAELIDFSCDDLMRENGGKLLIRDLDWKFEEIIMGASLISRNE